MGFPSTCMPPSNTPFWSREEWSCALQMKSQQYQSTHLMKITSLWQSRGLVIDYQEKLAEAKISISQKNKQSLIFSTCISSPPFTQVLRALQSVLQCLAAWAMLLRSWGTATKLGLMHWVPVSGKHNILPVWHIDPSTVVFFPPQ